MAAEKNAIVASLSQDEIDELDRVCERQNLSRAEAVRQAVRWYIGALRRLPEPEEPLPDEIEALREAEEELARGDGRSLRDVLRELDDHPERSR